MMTTSNIDVASCLKKYQKLTFKERNLIIHQTVTGDSKNPPEYSDSVPNKLAVENLEKFLLRSGVTVSCATSSRSQTNIGDANLHYNGNIIPLGTMPKHKALCLALFITKDLIK